MENKSRFCVRFHCGFRSTQPTVVIESFYRTHVNTKYSVRLETAPTEWDPVNLVLLQRVYVVFGFGIVHKRCRIGSVEVFLNVSVSIAVLVL